MNSTLPVLIGFQPLDEREIRKRGTIGWYWWWRWWWRKVFVRFQVPCGIAENRCTCLVNTNKNGKPAIMSGEKHDAYPGCFKLIFREKSPALCPVTASLLLSPPPLASFLPSTWAKCRERELIFIYQCESAFSAYHDTSKKCIANPFFALRA